MSQCYKYCYVIIQKYFQFLAVCRIKEMSLEKISHTVKYTILWVIVEEYFQNNGSWVSVGQGSYSDPEAAKT